MFPSRSVCSLALRSCRTCSRAARHPVFALPQAAPFASSIRFLRHSSMTSSPPQQPLMPAGRAPRDALNEAIGRSGRRYFIERVLQEKEVPPHRVYLATSENRKYVLKEVFQDDLEYLEETYRDLRSCPYIRLSQDTVPNPAMFVYNYFTDHLLGLAQKDLPIALTKRILKDTLRGLAALHDRNFVHTDVKANNILIEWEESNDGMVIQQVQLADLEDGACVPPGTAIVGKQAGNEMWRSPEAHARGPMSTPSDIFSFGIVCIYAVLKRVIFAVNHEKLAAEGMEPLAVILERQISYFADADGLDALLKHLGKENPWCEILQVIRDGFNKSNPRKPFSLWRGVDADFKDLICGLTNFDPAKRLSAHDALAHRWFAEV